MPNYPGTGHPDIATAGLEHELDAVAKRIVMMSLDAEGSGFIKLNGFDYTQSAPLAVVLVHPDTGAPYSATAAGGGAGSSQVTVHIEAINPATSLHALVNTEATVNIEGINPATSIHALVNTEATISAHTNVRRASGSEFRQRLIYIPTAAEQLPSGLGNAYNGIALKSRSSNSSNIYIGNNASVNGTPGDVNSGIELEPGDAVSIPVDVMTRLYAIAPTATSVMSIMQVIPPT